MIQIRPSLRLDFSSLATFDPRLSFTRGSTATYTDALGVVRTAPANAPRFDYDPITLVCRGLLIEGSRANALLNSEDLSAASWTNSQTAETANTVAAPNGTTTADKLTELAATAEHTILQDVTLTVNTQRCLSVWAQAAERSTIRLRLLDAGATSNFVSAFFDLTGSGTARDATNGGNGSGALARIEQYPNGWFRCFLMGTPNTSGTTVRAEIALSTGGTTTSYLGVVSSGVQLWGAQLEVSGSSFGSTYIATTSVAVTRSADACTMATTGWLSAAEGTLFAEATPTALSNNTRIISLNAGGANEEVRISVGGSPLIGATAVGGVTQASITVGTNVVLGQAVNSAIAYAANDVQFARDGVLGTRDTSGTIPTVTTLDIGSVGAASHLYGCVRRALYFPRRMTDAQLQALTA